MQIQTVGESSRKRMLKVKVAEPCPFRITPRYFSFTSGKSKRFMIVPQDPDVELDITWSINQSENCGHIDESGLYIAPEIILKNNRITIVATDLDSGLTDEITVSLLAPKIMCCGIDQPQIIFVGAGSTKLKININDWSLDKAKIVGAYAAYKHIRFIRNQEIVKEVSPFVGRIENDSYYPPDTLDCENPVLMKIKIEMGAFYTVNSEHFILLIPSRKKESIESMEQIQLRN